MNRKDFYHSLLTADQERELLILSQGGDRPARDRLVAANMRFVLAIAKRYTRYGAPLDDLVSAGAMGLLLALARFDVTKQTRLTTYAVHWVRREVRQAVRDAKIIRVPRGTEQALKGRRRKTKPETIRALLAARNIRGAIEVNPEGRQLVDHRTPDPVDAASFRENIDRANCAMQSLTAHERYILRHRFSLMESEYVSA